ncbi:SDR family oxidoreductase [Flavobacterium selenitireducens]|uniref:SDR family oxidoreductase n=1 Tax=Flavobacterium selenitireducens TaxID=2722704 RepID=UPI001CC30305|nr:SDR family oxidoreductase [Flavobacterium selenitireducens]
MATKNNISILGCGWLGLPLAKTLAASGFHIKGSTTSDSKLQSLAQSGIEPHLLKLEPDGILGDVTAFLGTSSTLIIDFPPNAKSENGSYATKIGYLVPHIVEAGIKFVLLVSSTSVYGRGSGLATEEMTISPTTESGKQLLEAEQILLKDTHFQTTVLRFGGLIGDERHPVFHLSGKENIENPEGPINLIHREDCLGIILKIIENKIWGEVFNAVAPYHPTREEYYSEKAQDLELPPPHFSKTNQSSGKIVSTGKLLRYIKYNFLHPEL